MQAYQLFGGCLAFILLVSFLGSSTVMDPAMSGSNGPPQIDIEFPKNGSANISVYLAELVFRVNGLDYFQYTVSAEPDFIGGVQQGSCTVAESVHVPRRHGMLSNETTYFWSVSVTNGTVWINQTYWFTTVPEVFQGYTLFTPMSRPNESTYLIDRNGEIVHTWPTPYRANYGVYMVENGSILRPCLRDDLSTRAVQKIAWNGTVTWEYEYCSGDYWLTHDLAPLPNGNILLLALEKKTADQAIAVGRNPAMITEGYILPAYLVEIRITGPTSGEVVWEWHLWDHMVQDFDQTKANYGVVGNHPELLDVNFMRNTDKDWIHPNTVHYNPTLDQVIISSRHLGEFWIIDHSTTTEEAATHTGGIRGRGGDFLYRWGNPQTYRAGNASNQKLFGPHDPQWIEPGCPGEGDIIVFNNGWGRPDGSYSTVDQITPPLDASGNYTLVPHTAYEPRNLTWQYNPEVPFYAAYISGCERLPNGNTIVCSGPTGNLFEVTQNGTTVWSFNNTHPIPGCSVFRVRRYYAHFYPPNTPMFTGPTNGTASTMYYFRIMTTDPDGDSIYYSIDWGDNTPVELHGPYESGEEITIRHIWQMENHYQIQCQAKDSYHTTSRVTNWTIDIGAPYRPGSPSPTDGASGVAVPVNLSWTGGDPDPDDIVTYDVYFGTNDPPQIVAHNQSSLTYQPENLSYNTQYYWRIVAWDNHLLSAQGPLWTFTTHLNSAPSFPSDPVPENGAQDTPIKTTINWTGGDPDGNDTCLYDIYFGTYYPPLLIENNYSATSYYLPTLAYTTQYYWRIVAWDNHGFTTSGPDWTFFTQEEPDNPPYIPSSPQPSDGEIDVPLSPILTWWAGDPDGDHVVYDVYFGSNMDPPLVYQDQNMTSFVPGLLNFSTTYFWHIIARDDHGVETEGPLWQFSTVQNLPPNPPAINGPTKGKKGVPLTYTFVSIDLEGQNISYEIDWGDGNLTQWYGPVGSNVVIALNHTWAKKGPYLIKARARDSIGAIGDWGTLSVTMPYVSRPLIQLLQYLLDRFPNAFPLLRQYVSGIIF